MIDFYKFIEAGGFMLSYKELIVVNKEIISKNKKVKKINQLIKERSELKNVIK